MSYEHIYNEDYAATLSEEQRQIYRGFCEKAARAKSKEEMAHKARNEYRRNWAKANPDKVRAQQARYWLKKAEEAVAVTSGNDEKAPL